MLLFFPCWKEKTYLLTYPGKKKEKLKLRVFLKKKMYCLLILLRIILTYDKKIKKKNHQSISKIIRSTFFIA